MAKGTDEVNKMPVPEAVPFPKMLTLDEVQEILNLGKPLVYALVKSGELGAAPVWWPWHLAGSRGRPGCLH